MNKVIFLDRDGTINIEKNYLYKIEDFEFISGSIEAIKIFHELGYKVVVITNQSGVARGYYKEEDIKKLHKYINNILKKNGTCIDNFYYCPHHVDGIIKKYKVDCNCRKPKIGMLEKAKKDYNIDLENSILIGDKKIDIETGKNGNLKKCILVKSGHKIKGHKVEADDVFKNILEYAKYLKKLNSI